VSIGPKRIVFRDKHSPLIQRAMPELLNTFSLGVEKASTGNIMKGIAVMLVMAPIMFVVLTVFRPLRLCVLVLLAWLLWGFADASNTLKWLFMGLAFAMLYFRDLREFLAQYGLTLIVFLSGGSFLRWICSGNLSGDPFRQMILASEGLVDMITTLLVVLPEEHRYRYDGIMDVINDGNLTEEEAMASLERFVAMPIVRTAAAE
jgi:hypothetical protein